MRGSRTARKYRVGGYRNTDIRGIFSELSFRDPSDNSHTWPSTKYFPDLLLSTVANSPQHAVHQRRRVKQASSDNLLPKVGDTAGWSLCDNVLSVRYTGGKNIYWGVPVDYHQASAGSQTHTTTFYTTLTTHFRQPLIASSRF